MRVDSSRFADSFASLLNLSTLEIAILRMFHILVLVASLCGNSVVLYGSRKYHAIDMDKVSIVLIGRASTFVSSSLMRKSGVFSVVPIANR